MGKINLLPSQVYNQISAGEVVERPYSVVKELVENAIDAGATELTIEIENGGISLIRVSDDGNGMDKEDLGRAFLPHATSKIKEANDLATITTLGFRGEALASIGAVAKVTISSLEKGKDVGYEISCEGGVLSSVEESPVSGGTTVCVRDLFFNTPARAKFLKTPKGEESDISNIVSRLILANPTVAITYEADGKTIYRSFGGNAEEALLAVYGKAAVENSFYIDTFKHGLHIHGYLGKHHYTKANRTYQTVILNGRYISNQTIASAAHNAYQSYLMKRNYPFYCLYIDMPGEFVDVNVHPNKTDVRFANNQVVYGAIYSVISSVLDGASSAIDIVKSVGSEFGKTEMGEKSPVFVQSQIGELVPEVKEVVKEVAQPQNDYSDLFSDVKNSEVKPVTGYAADSFSVAPFTASASAPVLTDKEKDAIFEENKRFLEELERKKQAANPAIFAETVKKEGEIIANAEDDKLDRENVARYAEFVKKTEDGAYESEKQGMDGMFTSSLSVKNDSSLNRAKDLESAISVSASAEKMEAPVSILENMVYVGQVFKTYLVFECGATMYLVDQHAAHERMIYDRLKAQAAARTVVTQPMLLPYVLTVNPQESLFLKSHLDDFVEMGIEIDDFGGNTFKISALPVDLCELDLGKFFEKVLSDLDYKKEFSVGDLFKEKIMQLACKSAIKAGFSISEGEILLIREKLAQNPGLTCPHGRPVAVKVSKTELEKWFKRIV